MLLGVPLRLLSGCWWRRRHAGALFPCVILPLSYQLVKVTQKQKGLLVSLLHLQLTTDRGEKLKA